MKKHELSRTKLELKRKARNRLRRLLEHLDRIPRPVPKAYRRVQRARFEWHGVEVPLMRNRKERRTRFGPLFGIMPQWKVERAHRRRNKARVHRRLMRRRAA